MADEQPRRRWTDTVPPPINGRPTTGDLLNVSNAMRDELGRMEDRLMRALGDLRDDWEGYRTEHAAVHTARLLETDAVHGAILDRLRDEDLHAAERRGRIASVAWLLTILGRHWQLVVAVLATVLALMGNVHVDFTAQ